MSEPVITTWLELRARAELVPARTTPGLTLRAVDPPDASVNRRLYLAVGEAYAWIDRAAWPIERWRAQVERADVETWLALFDGEEAGYVELERHADGSVEIAYFGLLERFVGRGLGGAFLAHSIERAWAMEATRVWVHTCTLDHPAALANYRARGMRIVREERSTA
jgi:GNAT superfamily N-acetyltransferase